ncbi:hypothetical protein ACROYT_G006489 [Oculina patagonica]
MYFHINGAEICMTQLNGRQECKQVNLLRDRCPWSPRPFSFYKGENMLNISINNGSQNSSHAWYGFDVGRTLQISLTAMYSITFITALLGNILLLHIIRLHRPFNSVSILISNMAASDLLTALFAMPYSTAYLYVQHRWFGGRMDAFPVEHQGSIQCDGTNASPLRQSPSLT